MANVQILEVRAEPIGVPLDTCAASAWSVVGCLVTWRAQHWFLSSTFTLSLHAFGARACWLISLSFESVVFPIVWWQ